MTHLIQCQKCSAYVMSHHEHTPEQCAKIGAWLVENDGNLPEEGSVDLTTWTPKEVDALNALSRKAGTIWPAPSRTPTDHD